MREAVIIGAVRTAIGKFRGALSEVSAPELGAVVIKEAIRRAGIKPEEIDEVIMGNVLQAGLGQNPARQSAIHAGVLPETGAVTINKVCGSGLKAVILAAQSIKSGDNDIVVAGGMENMTRTPYLLEKARTGYNLGDAKLIDSIVRDGLWDVYNDYHIGCAAEVIVDKYNVTREEQDRYALESHIKAVKAAQAGKFKDEIVPVTGFRNKCEEVIFKEDERPNKETSIEKLSKLKPVFKQDGTITAGNASGINDGAAAVVVASKEKAKELGILPLATIRGYAVSGVAPEMVMMSPVLAVRKVLERVNLKIGDINLIELNEAFAVQPIVVMKELGLDSGRVNIKGGAVALGHPIGASGARILVTLLYAMKEEKARYGLATLCMGGGNGLAMVIET